MSSIYFDNAATTPCDPRVAQAMGPYWSEVFGNASSPHQFGQKAKKAMEDARCQLASCIGADPAEIVFTSGATESNNQAIFGVAQRLKDRGRRILVSAIEHHSVLEPCEQLAKQGFDVQLIPVDAQGCVDLEQLKSLINDETILVAVMHASNEIGTIQPIAAIGEITRQKDIPFLVDACQTIGHIPVNVQEMNCDLLSLSAHKFYGPKGIGALFIRSGLKIGRYLHGGDQERDRRASTQNVPAIVGLGEAICLAQEVMGKEAEQHMQWRDDMIQFIEKELAPVRINGHQYDRLPNNIHCAFDDIKGESLLAALDMQGIAVSMGSACTSGVLGPSHVLKAIGLTDDQALGALRITLGRFIINEDIDVLKEKLKSVVNTLR